jgi:hypothetical protein
MAAAAALLHAWRCSWCWLVGLVGALLLSRVLLRSRGQQQRATPHPACEHGGIAASSASISGEASRLEQQQSVTRKRHSLGTARQQRMALYAGCDGQRPP